MPLRIAQLADSAFPVGAFSHSFGLETALKEGRVDCGADLRLWLSGHLHGNLASADGPAVFWSHRISHSVRSGNPQAIRMLADLDQRLTLTKLAQESRTGAAKIGRRYARLAAELYPEAGFDRYEAWIRGGQCYGHPAIVHGWLCRHLEADARTAVQSFLYGAVNALAQNAQRAAAIGQTEAQRTLLLLLPEIDLAADRITERPPTLRRLFHRAAMEEIEAMRHETLYSRLFMS